MQTIEIGYTPRTQFVGFHKRRQRWAAIVAHRRAGKTVACVADLVDAALRCDRQEPRFAYVAPYFTQAKDIAWTYLKRFISGIPGASAHEGELRVDLPGDRRIRLYGADNADRMRGIYLDGAVMDEYGDIDPNVWPEIIRPALADRQGWATFIGTPKGRNAFWQLYDKAQRDPEWFTVMLKASETGLVPAQELRDARRDMSDDQYAQEFECSFQAAIRGAYYGHAMEETEREGRICRVPHEPKLATHTAWDLGIGDATAIWFAQAVGGEIRLIDYYEASGVGLDHYAKMLQAKPYVYGDHIVPHDIAVSELGTGKTRQSILAGLGIRTRIAPKVSVDDGIGAARMMIPRCWFDAEKCGRGIEALRQYRAEYDAKLDALRLRPRHDWTSHAADAFRYLALGLQEKRRVRESDEAYVPRDAVTGY